MANKSLGMLTLDMVLKTGSYTEPLDKATRQTQTRMKDIEKSAQSAGDSVSRSLKALGIGLSLNEIRKYSDSWTDLNSRVRLAVGPMGDATGVMKELEQIARNTYSSLETSADGYLNNAAALTELGFSTQQQLQFTNALAAGLVASGAKAERAASVTNALSDSIAAGVLRGQNWNTVYKQGGEVATALAVGLGVTRAELDKMARSGQLTADKVVPALIGQMDVLQKKADSMGITVGDAFGQLDNAALKVFGSLAEGSNASGLTSAAILKLADNLETVVDVAAIAATIVGGRLVASSLESAIAFVENAKAAAANATAQQLAADATTRRTFVDKASALQALERARADLALATTTKQVKAATEQLTAAKGRAIAATDAYNKAAAKSVAMNNALSSTATRARAAFSLLGGPAGVVFTAVAAFSYFALTGKSAKDSAAELNQQLDILNLNYGELTQKQAALAKLQANEKLAETIDELAEAQEKLRLQQVQLQKAEQMDPRYKNVQAQAIDGLNKRIVESEALIERLTITHGRYQRSLEQINGVLDRAPESVRKGSEEFEKQSAALERQIALFGLNTDAAKLLYEIQSGNLAGKLSDEEQKRLLALAEQYDLLRKNAEAAKEYEAEQKKASDSVAAFIENARETQTALQAQLDGTDRLGRARQELINFERQLADIKSKKTLSAFEKELLAQSAATQAQLEKNVALEEEARIRNGLAGLFYDLQTDEEKRFDLFKQRIKILEDAKKLSGTVDVDMVQRVTGDLFENSPMSGRLDVSVSGPVGELDRIADEENKLNEWYIKQTEMLNQARAEQLNANIDWNAQELALKEQHEQAMAQIESQKRTAQIAVMGDFFAHLASMQDSESKKARQIAKAAAIAQALVNTYQAATGAYAAMAPIPVVGPALGAAAAAAAIVAGMANVNAIRGMAHSGLDYIPQEGTWLLDKGERVLSPRQNEDLTRFLSAVENDSGSAASGRVAGASMPEFKFYLQAPNQEAMMELIMENRGAIAGMVSSAFEEQGIRLA